MAKYGLGCQAQAFQSILEWGRCSARSMAFCLSGELWNTSPTYRCWLSRQWVASMVRHIWTLLMTPVLGSLGSEQLPWCAAFAPCWWYLSLAHQEVSGFGGEHWAEFGPCWQCLSMALKRVSGFCGDPHLGLAYYAHLWLFRMWVAGKTRCCYPPNWPIPDFSVYTSVPCCLPNLLIAPINDGPTSVWVSLSIQLANNI